jgi:CPA2 family monovalent cation:H+ antiporter-2
MEIDVLLDLLIVLGMAIVVIALFNAARLPSLAGFLIVGMLAGPYGLEIVPATVEVERLADIGVILLLFGIGLEFSVERFVRIQRVLWTAGPMQLLLAILAVMAIGISWGGHWKTMLFWGFLVSLSSTAIVLKLLSDHAVLESPQGQVGLGLLIFQDLAIIPMIFLTPYLSLTGAAGASTDIIFALVKSAVAITVIFVGARFLIPRLLEVVVRQRQRELFVLTVLTLCLGTAWMTAEVGLSLALGAFISGIIISESPYGQQAISDILPFRDGFGAIFFISMGMLFDGRLFLEEPGKIAAFIFAILLLKGVTTFLSTWIAGYPIRIAVLSGFFLAQIGEFSFVLSHYGVAEGIIKTGDYQLFIAISVITMFLTPFEFHGGNWFVDRLSPLRDRLQSSPRSDVSNHVLIVGFGLNGQNVARVLKMAGIPYRILEMNPETVWKQRDNGEPITYGDATHRAVLLAGSIEHARVMVVAISDPPSTRRVVMLGKQLNPKLHMIVRTRYVHEMEALYSDGADEVIPEEYETSVEIFTRLLKRYLVPADLVNHYVSDVRRHGYEMFRKLHQTYQSPSWLESELAGVAVESFRLPVGSALNGKRMEELRIRSETGVTIVAVRRGEATTPNPDGTFVLAEGDLLIGLGEPEALSRFAIFLD